MQILDEKKNMFRPQYCQKERERERERDESRRESIGR
jgi:hypothetical protein